MAGFEWETHFPTRTLPSREVDVKTLDKDGKTIFEQKGVIIPKDWSDLAAQIVADKYFHKGERSVFALVDRVVKQIGKWGMESGYFCADIDRMNFELDLDYILLSQMASFNSPVWFNLGVKGREPQSSACFILDVDDTMGSIIERTGEESIIFKGGSGAGANSSKLRGSQEPMSTGGLSSGPVSFMQGWDAFANVIKSGGTTRRAAKAEILDFDHPDILEFIRCKAIQEQLSHLLQSAGKNTGTINQNAILHHQNANHSVRVNDAFMKKALDKVSYPLVGRGSLANVPECDTAVRYYDSGSGKIYEEVNAHDILMEIARCTWECGDPGLFMGDTVERWNTVPGQNPIVSCNPCFEFIAPVNTACNLASINLVKFIKDDGSFNLRMYGQVVRILIIAMDIIVEGSVYPTEKIAENSKKLRPLGLGYTNVHAMLMRLGIRYDSDRARDILGCLTAIHTAVGYETSSEIIEECNFDARFDISPLLSILNQHQEKIDGKKHEAMPGLSWQEAQDAWQDAEHSIVGAGARNSQISLLAPTGTISFMMDCETTGIEPLIMIGGVKRMADTGVLQFEVAECVKIAAKRLGIDHQIYGEVDGNFVWNLNEDQLSLLKKSHVFDTALGSVLGKSIKPDGHIKMMAAVQPFLSGGISKTINVPNKTTVEEIFDMYIECWKLGLKAVSIYRDGSKAEQVYITQEKEEPKQEEVEEPREKKHLPSDRDSKTHKFNIGGHKGYLTVGFFPDGAPGEVFITMAKEGSTVRGFMDTLAVMVSVGLQYGIPLEVICSKFMGTKFEPHGVTDNSNIRIAQSVPDYIGRFLKAHYVKEDVEEELPEELSEDTNENSDSGNPCPSCGALMRRVGSCDYCFNCHTSNGCS